MSLITAFFFFFSFQSLTLEEVLGWAQSLESLMATKCEYDVYAIFEEEACFIRMGGAGGGGGDVPDDKCKRLCLPPPKWQLT